MPMGRTSSGAGPAPDEVLADWLARGSPRPRQVLELLRYLDEPQQAPVLSAAVQRSGLPRRTVEEVLRSLGAVRTDAGSYALPEDAAAAVREALLRAPALDPTRLERQREAVQRLVARVPAPDTSLDHVQATPETVLQRAVLLHRELTAADTVLFVGDHDLTGLALAGLYAPGQPAPRIVVVDVDERLLAYVDDSARELGVGVDVAYADLRLKLPSALTGACTLAFTDPPYTPAGVALFVARAVEALSRPEDQRVLLAYGYSDRTPALGLEVQEALSGLRLLFEAVLPGFNTYVGAEAIGSRAALYVLRPTRRTPAAVRRLLGEVHRFIYTRGGQAEEAQDAPVQTADVRSVLDRAPEALLVAADLAQAPPAAHRQSLSALLMSGPAHPHRGRSTSVLWCPGERPDTVLRALLASSAPKVVVVAAPLPVGPGPRRVLEDVVGLKYAPSVSRSLADGLSATTYARTPADALTGPGQRALRHVLDRPHGKLGNVLREALIRESATARLTRGEARDLVARHVTPFEAQQQPVDLAAQVWYRVAEAARHADQRVVG